MNTSSPKFPHVTRLLALAHHLQGLIDKGIVRDYADIARLSNLSRARLSQIISLTFLAPEIQQEILFLSPGKHLAKHVKERNLRKILKTLAWKRQREIWKSSVNH